MLGECNDKSVNSMVMVILGVILVFFFIHYDSHSCILITTSCIEISETHELWGKEHEPSSNFQEFNLT